MAKTKEILIDEATKLGIEGIDPRATNAEIQALIDAKITELDATDPDGEISDEEASKLTEGKSDESTETTSEETKESTTSDELPAQGDGSGEDLGESTTEVDQDSPAAKPDEEADPIPVEMVEYACPFCEATKMAPVDYASCCSRCNILMKVKG